MNERRRFSFSFQERFPLRWNCSPSGVTMGDVSFNATISQVSRRMFDVHRRQVNGQLLNTQVGQDEWEEIGR